MQKWYIFTVPDQILSTFETTTYSFSKIATKTCFHQCTIETQAEPREHIVTWTDCHVNTGCPRGQMLITHWSKHALWRKLPDESKRAPRHTFLDIFFLTSAIEIAHEECGRLPVSDFSHALLMLHAMFRTWMGRYIEIPTSAFKLGRVTVPTADAVATGEVNFIGLPMYRMPL